MISRSLWLVWLGAALPASARVLLLQAADSLPQGATIRLVAPAVAPGILTATVLAAEHDTLILKVAGEAAGLVVPLARVERLELYRGRGSSTGAIVGASVAGLAVGAGAGWLAGPSLCDPNDDTWQLFCGSERSGRTLGAVIFGLIGAMGAAWLAGRPHERWHPVALEGLRLGTGPRGSGLAVGLSLSF
jgi:hypothetical protein